jgi:hypothetical protein
MKYTVGGLRYFKYIPNFMPPLKSNAFLQMIHRDPGCPDQLKKYLERTNVEHIGGITWDTLNHIAKISMLDNRVVTLANFPNFEISPAVPNNKSYDSVAMDLR